MPNKIKHYKSVFVISTKWSSSNVFHFLISSLSRLAPWIDIVRNNEEMIIHTGDATDGSYLTLPLVKWMFDFLGIDKSRIIYEPVYGDQVNYSIHEL